MMLHRAFFRQGQHQIQRQRLKIERQHAESAPNESQNRSGHAAALNELVQSKSSNGKANVPELEAYLWGLGISKSRVKELMDCLPRPSWMSVRGDREVEQEENLQGGKPQTKAWKGRQQSQAATAK
jgi:hypothetical protein